MHFLPFEIYSAPFPKHIYGCIYEIPEYLTQKELEVIGEQVREKDPHVTVDSYPNLSAPLSFTPEKNQIILDNAYSIMDYIRNSQAANYSFSHYLDITPPESCKFILREQIQGSPSGMRPYPPHVDTGKLMTILIPLCPVKSIPTIFHGKRDNGKFVHEEVSVPWKINHAYLFCSSEQYSWHSYQGSDSNRWVLVTNVYQDRGQQQLTTKPMRLGLSNKQKQDILNKGIPIKDYS